MGSGQSSETGPIKVPEFPPGVDGQLLQRETVQTRDLLVPIQMSTHFTTGLESSLDDLKQVIVAQASEGFKLVGVYLPIYNKGVTMDNDNGFSGDYTTRILCIFQTAPQHRGIVQEVVFQDSVLTLSKTSYPEETGHEDLYEKLKTAAAQGASLSCVIDDPNKLRTIKDIGYIKSNVHLVCNRPADSKPVPVEDYVIVNCPIQLKDGGLKDLNFTMPTLKSLLQTYTTQGHKIAGVHNPPDAKIISFSTTETSCHLIFQKTGVNYHFCVVDGDFRFELHIWHKNEVDHSRYVSIVNDFASKGWELAAIIDMKDYHKDSTFSDKMSRTARMIFQAPEINGGRGGELSA